MPRSGSGFRINRDGSFRFRGKETHEILFKVIVDAIENVTAFGDVVVALEKTEKETPVSKPVKVIHDGSKRTLIGQTLTGLVTLTVGKGGQFKPKLVRIAIKLSNIDGPTITSTYINVTDYIDVGSDGKRIQVNMDNNASVFATVSCQNASEQFESDQAPSPTSIMQDSPIVEQKKRASLILQGSGSGFFKGKLMKAFGSKRDMSLSPGHTGSQKQIGKALPETGTNLQDLQTENNRLFKLVTVTKTGTRDLDDVRKENERLRIELKDLRENSVPTEQFEQLVRELCKARETKAAVVLDKQTLEYTLKTLTEKRKTKQRKSLWR